MANRIPVKAIKTGSTVTALGEFEPGDQIPSDYLQDAFDALMPTGYIDGLQMQWVSGTALTLSSGAAYIEGPESLLNVPSAIAKTGLSLTASTWYHVYLYDNAGTPDVEIVTTAPATAYNGTARSKTGDTSRRYIGSVKSNASSSIVQFAQSGTDVFWLTNVGGTMRALSGGTSTTVTSISLAGMIPVTARIAAIRMANTATNAYLTTGTPDFSFGSGTALTSVNPAGDIHMKHPVSSGQLMQYVYQAAPTGGSAIIDVEGYTFER